jgi:hypothetical protein
MFFVRDPVGDLCNLLICMSITVGARLYTEVLYLRSIGMAPICKGCLLKKGPITTGSGLISGFLRASSRSNEME